jgi:hypothetical protein
MWSEYADPYMLRTAVGQGSGFVSFPQGHLQSGD